MTVLVIVACVLAYLGAGVGTVAIAIRRGWDLDWMGFQNEDGAALLCIAVWPIPWVAIGGSRSWAGIMRITHAMVVAIHPKPVEITPVEDDPEWSGHDWTPPPDAIRGAS